MSPRLSGGKDELSSSHCSCRAPPRAKRTTPKSPVPARMRHQRPGKPDRRDQRFAEAGTPRPPAQRQQRPSGNTRSPSWRYTPRPLGIRTGPEQESRAHRVPAAPCTETPAESRGTRHVQELKQAGDSRPIAVQDLRRGQPAVPQAQRRQAEGSGQGDALR